MANQVCVLGATRVIGRDGQPTELGGRRQRRLLAALAVRHGEVVSIDALLDIVFEGEPTDAAGRTLQSYVSRLRRVVEDGAADESVIVRTGHGYVLRLDSDRVDASAFATLVAAARRAATDRDHPTAVRRFDEALRLWHGRPYAEFADEEWAAAEAHRLTELRSTAIEDRAESQLAIGEHTEVIPDLEQHASEHPTRERPRALLMTALYRSGRQGDALRVYQDFFRFLADEVGLQPSAALRDLESKVVSSDASLDLDPPNGTPLRGYQLFEEIGSGAFSTVHRGTQPSVGRDVAVKVIRAELANDPRFVRRFETEAHMVANLEHPHIVPLYDYWREHGNAYLVMRWLRGGSLRRAAPGGSAQRR